VTFRYNLNLNIYRNPCLLEPCGLWKNVVSEYDGLKSGFNWLISTINKNEKFLRNRINFHKLMLEDSTKLFQSHRPYTASRRKVSSTILRRMNYSNDLILSSSIRKLIKYTHQSIRDQKRLLTNTSTGFRPRNVMVIIWPRAKLLLEEPIRVLFRMGLSKKASRTVQPTW
jgi:hypothetical protein